ncbi:DUF2807 domain-containing protein [Robiginitalea sp. M366]|uniref:head GIN domain-containing protein n=1 Tax=Robiginitalea aestuariiviva TaxID=3036903 RepID=UPI00240E76E1|nr:head GIN domain-containing protein [Robiginitalea aestuariiviva]MDG1572594.1 DUF2807 domain-containing protein [Robiginitalea aestuariiviva]
MKTKWIPILALVLASCNLNAQWGKSIKGDGNVVTIDRNVGDYDAIALSGWFDLELVSGREGRITLKGESNLLEHIKTEVKDGKLVIKTEKGKRLEPSSWRSGGITITVPVEEVEAVSLSGSGDVVGKTVLKAPRFKAAMSGSGDMTLEVEAEQVEATLSGSGDIELGGQAGALEVRISGSGDVNAYDMDAARVEAYVSGSADIYVTARESLMARVSGSGDIHYRGNPEKVDSKTSGSGDITKG